MNVLLLILCPLLALASPSQAMGTSQDSKIANTPPPPEISEAPVEVSLDALSPPASPLWGVVGDQTDQWLVLPGLKDTLGVLHRQTTDPQATWKKVGTLRGKILPQGRGMTTRHGRLWLVFANRAVQSMVVRQLESAPIAGPVLVYKVHPNLPGKGALRQIAVTTQGLWTLLKTQDGHLHLQVLQRQNWHTRALPADLDPQGKTWMTTSSPSPRTRQRDWPTLIHLTSNGTLTVFEYQKKKWHPIHFTEPLQSKRSHSFTFLRVGGQLVLCQGSDEESAELFLLRSPQVLPLGTLKLSPASPGSPGSPGSPDSPWQRQLFTAGSQVAMLRLDDKAIALTRTMNLQGHLSKKEMPLILDRSGPSLADPRRLVVAIAMAVSILVMFGLWRHDPKAGEPGSGKPEAGGLGAGGSVAGGMMLASFGRRGVALIIDLLPSMMIAAGLCNVRLRHLLDHWPGVGSDWSQMTPGLIAIGIYITHTTITELFTARTLGKMILGLHVRSLNGQLPDVWQIFWRNLLKILDLVAWYVLPILMLVSPHRQRLGDVVGKTIVVQRNPSAPGSPPPPRPKKPENPPHSKNDPPESSS